MPTPADQKLYDKVKEKIDKETALEMIRDFETNGLSHSVWTVIPPFIAGICNCDRSDCLALKVNISHDLKMMFRAEYVAVPGS